MACLAQQLSWGRLVWRRYGERERSRTIITKPYILYYEQWRATEDWMWRSTVFKTPVDWWLYIGDHDMYYPICIYIYTVYTQTLIYYIYIHILYFLKNIHTLGTVIIPLWPSLLIKDFWMEWHVMLRCSDVDGATPQGALPSLGCWWRGLSVCQGGSAGTWEVPEQKYRV